LDIVHDLRSQALDARSIAKLQYDEFKEYIRYLNQLCENMVDGSGKYLQFAIKKGTDDTTLWRSTVQICCMKVNSAAQQVESIRTLGLARFLKLRESLLSLSDESTASRMQFDLMGGAFQASMVMEKLDNMESSDAASECIICMERKVDSVLSCSHCYCLPCIEQWKVAKNYCPVCHAYLSNTDDAWVIEEAPNNDEIRRYLLSVTDSGSCSTRPVS